jgi:hypothetical protein
MSLFIPTYFSPISQYGVMVQAEKIEFEVADNFQKQTYRNRCYIYGANGKQLLTVPIRHSKCETKQKTKDIKIETGAYWQKQHFKSLKTAYNCSPFFEFYEDDLIPIFEKKYQYLHDLNFDTFEFVNQALELGLNYETTKAYKFDQRNDYRVLSEVKHHLVDAQVDYHQLFESKHGFIKNLSVLDLIFMEGPNSISFLKK